TQNTGNESGQSNRKTGGEWIHCCGSDAFEPMTKPLYVYDDSLLKYRFNSTHPFNQMRLKMTTDLLQSAGFLLEENIIKPRRSINEELLLVHTQYFLEVVIAAGKGQLTDVKLESYGLNTDDSPSFQVLHEKSSMLVGATLTAVDAVM